MIPDHDTIVAPATAAGGAIAVVRVSGREAFALCDRMFRGRKPLAEADGYTVHYGEIMDGDRIVDDVLAAVFRAPHSYTGEDSVEISCHGSSYIVSEILRLLTAAGGRMAQPGEFTIRAYLAGKLDLSQAEAVADTIAASSRAAHALASTQMRGGYSDELERLRDKLLNLTSLLELELDFSEEDVEFADRTALRETMQRIGAEIDRLRSSFSLGNAIKEGVAVAIAGAPNVGKSTLLNRLLNEERAMVSEIAGTTRDVIEERANIGGILFRFLDTAGIRSTDDRLERMGIERTIESIRRAQLVIHPQQGYGQARHFHGGGKFADVRHDHPCAPLIDKPAQPAVHDEQFFQRSGTQPVDHYGYLVACVQGRVGGELFQHQVGCFIGCQQGRLVNARFAMNSHTDFHTSLRYGKGRAAYLRQHAG